MNNNNEEYCQRACTEQTVKQYLRSVDGHYSNDLYDLVIQETEKGMISIVLTWCHGNQSKAAKILGITRTTLRSKIRKLGI